MRLNVILNTATLISTVAHAAESKMARPEARMSATSIPQPMKLHTGEITSFNPIENRSGAISISVASCAASIPDAPGVLPTESKVSTKAPIISQEITDFAEAMHTRETAIATTITKNSLIEVTVSDSSAEKGNDPGLTLLKQQGFNHDEALKIKMMYQEACIPLNEKTLIGEFHDGNRIGPLEPLGSGTTNNVFRVKYRVGNGTKVFDGVFKQEKAPDEILPGANPPQEVIGLTDSSGGAVRNVATFRLNQMLGWDVIPFTTFGIADGKLGTVMAYVEGEEPTETEDRIGPVTNHPLGPYLREIAESTNRNPDALGNVLKAMGLRGVYFDENDVYVNHGKPNPNINYKDPILVEETLKLQTLDQMVGHPERHAGSWLIILGTGRNGKQRVLGVKGFDNDVALGTKPMKVNDIVASVGSQLVTFSPLYPEIIYNDVTVLTDQQIEDKFTGLLPPDVIDPFKSRIHDTQENLETAFREGRIVNDLELEDIADDPRFHPMNSYLERAKAVPNFDT